MHPYWKQESDLAQFVEAQRTLSIRDISMAGGYQPLDEDFMHLDQTIQSLQLAQKRVSHNPEHSQRLGELIDFTRQFRDEFPNQTPEQSFERIQILRRWLFWLPPSMLRNSDSDINALPILAQFYAIGISLDIFFPELGGAYLGAPTVEPIEEIYRIIATHSATDPFNADLRLALTLMDLPRGIVARYRSRLPWSPRSSIDQYSPGPPSPYHHTMHEYPLVTSSSPDSASASYAAYTPPLHSPPAVTVANSPFQLQDGFIATAPPSLYPPSPHLLDAHNAHLGLSDMNHGHTSASIPQSSAFTPPYGGDVLCTDMPRADASLGLNMDVYSQTHPFAASLWA